MTTRSMREKNIDFIRSSSMLYIVGFWHLLDYTKAFPWYNNILTFRITWCVLSVFVFISGYFIGQHKLQLSIESILAFYKKRLVRIFPLYVISIFLFYIMDISDAITSAKAVFMVSMFFKPAPITLWFISMLFVFYLISPFLIALFQSARYRIIVISCFIVLTFLIVYNHIFHLLDIRILAYFPSFVFGIIFANFDLDKFAVKYKFFTLLVISIFVSFILNVPQKNINLIISMPMLTLMPYYMVKTSRKFSHLLSPMSNLVSFISYSSYCMYLFHRPMFETFIGAYFPEKHALQVSYLVLICFPCIIFFSFLIQKGYDRIVTMVSARMASVGS